MTKQDFDLILIESFVHSTKQSYFNGKREEYRCDVDEYCTGLKESFKRLNDEVIITNPFRCVITKPNGEELFATLRNDVKVGYDDEDEPDNEFLRYAGMGKLSFPFKNSIDLRQATNGKFNFQLTAEMMEELWVDLEKYLQSVAPVEPQQPKADHSALLTALSKHVTGINPDEFTNIIETHQLTRPTKAKWIGKEKSEAAYFAKVFKISMPEFKKCFSFEDGSELKGHNRPTTKKPFKDLFKPFIK